MISKDYNLPVEKVKELYLYDNKSKFDKVMKKFKPKKTRKVHPYNVYLSDKSVIKMLLEENNTDNQTKINKEKGDLWRTYKKDPVILKKYKDISILENKGLVTRNYRTEMLTNWENHKDNVDLVLKDTTNYDLKSVVKLLKLDEEN